MRFERDKTPSGEFRIRRLEAGLAEGDIFLDGRHEYEHIEIQIKAEAIDGLFGGRSRSNEFREEFVNANVTAIQELALHKFAQNAFDDDDRSGLFRVLLNTLEDLALPHATTKTPKNSIVSGVI